MQPSQGSFKPYLNPVGAWALAFGCTIGWGAFLIPGTFLPDSGVLGSIVGTLIGTAIMLVIARNYHTMINQHPKAGGAFTFTTRVLGFDHGFLCAWFLCLTYVALIWANISAFALLARYTLGDALEVHYLYSVAGFDIYLDEVLLCMLALVIAAAICLFRKKLAQGAQIVFVLVLVVGLMAIFLLVLQAHPSTASIEPLFLPDRNPLLQIAGIIAVIPWAFVGFESISHSAEEFSFSPQKAFRIMAAAVAMAAFAYIIMLLISVLMIPGGYPTWLDYVNDLSNLSGLAAAPAFSAIQLALGDTGIALLAATMLGALFSSLVGNITCLSRLVAVMAENEIFPRSLGKIDDDGIPRRAILAITAISLFIPFLGRTAIGWNVDVANIGATIAYGYTSIAAYRYSKVTNDGRTRAFGIAGMGITVLFLLLMLLASNTLAQESYLILTGWVIAGFLLNYHVFKKDREHRYGRSSIVWVALFVLSIYTSFSFVWQSSVVNAEYATQTIERQYSELDAGYPHADIDEIVNGAIQDYHATEMRNYLLTLAIVIVSSLILLGNYAIMNRREMENAQELGEAREKAFTDKLTGVQSINAYRDKELDMNAGIRGGQMTGFALAICDINNVKEVNDQFGHQAGDDYICAGAKVICSIFQHSPVYRIGGDEFVVLLQGGDYECRQDLLEEFAARNSENLKTGGIQIAVGISDWRPGKDESLADMFARADIRMYQRKSELKQLARHA